MQTTTTTVEIAPEALRRWQSLMRLRDDRVVGRCSCGCRCRGAPTSRSRPVAQPASAQVSVGT